MQWRADGSSNEVPVAPLNEREREIAALIADGLTNQAIADRLGLARLTVSQHVATIQWRLGLTRRHEIAAWTLGQAWRTPGRSGGHSREFSLSRLLGCGPPLWHTHCDDIEMLSSRRMRLAFHREKVSAALHWRECRANLV